MFVPSAKHSLDCLKELEDEVRELHPILNVLFRKLPGIERVHYNQGSNELGADFILFRADPALLRTTCIGVVVKAGPIRQNTVEVERQIKECFIPRRAVDGTEIQIREVWVVSSQDITKNARDVINKQYADKKIEFIPAQDLASLIDRFAPDSFVTITPALQDFAESVLLTLEAEDQRSLIVPGMESFYIEPKFVRKNFDGYGKAQVVKGIKGLDDLLRRLVDSQLSVVEAGAGGGKSRLARELVRRVLASAQYADGKIIPIVDHAKAFAADVETAFGEILATARLSAKSEGHGLIFIDGFDELDIDNAQRADFVNSLIQAACEHNASVALLTRPFDEVSVLGGKVHAIDIFQIEPLKGTKAVEFLSRAAGQLDLKSRIISDLSKSNLLRALDGNPIAYILLGRLIAENHQDLPSNLTELFQKYSELVLGRWEITKGLRSQKEYEVLVEALIWLSSYMLDNELAEIARSELEQWIGRYCADRGIEVSAAELVERACGRNSVLYLKSTTGAVGFRHRAFCEFFYARNLDRKTDIQLAVAIFSPYWINSYYFLAGIKRDCPDLIKSLVALELESDSYRILRVLNFGNILLAGYLTPTEVCREAVSRLALETADLFIAGCTPSSKSPLTQLPTIQMLCALTAAFHGQYGYRHFKPSLEAAIFELESGGLTERNAIALFLLDTAYKEAGGTLKFDSLIEKFGEALPLAIKLAIQHESNRMRVMSDRIKRMERNLRRSFKSNKGSQEYLHKLYDVPVKQLDKKL